MEEQLAVAAVAAVAAQPFEAGAAVVFAAAEGDPHSAVVAERPSEAEALQVEPGSPVFVIERTTRAGDDAITCVRLAHPGASFRIVTREGR